MKKKIQNLMIYWISTSNELECKKKIKTIDSWNQAGLLTKAIDIVAHMMKECGSDVVQMSQEGEKTSA